MTDRQADIHIRHLAPCLAFGVKGFVRSFVIVEATKLIEPLLLRMERLGRGIHRVRLQCPVRSFVPTALLWFIWLDALVDDAQSLPCIRKTSST